MANGIQDLLGKIHLGDCVGGMKKLPDESVQLAFADPPFNIGYDYDEYEDRLESEKYLHWSRDWMQEVYRVLDASGKFWLAIGDEYAAELKVEAQQTWVSTRETGWFGTTRSEFIAKPSSLARTLTFSTSSKIPRSSHSTPARWPFHPPANWFTAIAGPIRMAACRTTLGFSSARLCDGFTSEEDTWYFPRVAGTFKERAGFHGCQMPEQLLGRIIKSCSNPDDVVLDPFSGSATTISVARKKDGEFLDSSCRRNTPSWAATSRCSSRWGHTGRVTGAQSKCTIDLFYEGAAQQECAAGRSWILQSRAGPTRTNGETDGIIERLRTQTVATRLIAWLPTQF